MIQTTSFWNEDHFLFLKNLCPLLVLLVYLIPHLLQMPVAVFIASPPLILARLFFLNTHQRDGLGNFTNKNNRYWTMNYYILTKNTLQSTPKSYFVLLNIGTPLIMSVFMRNDSQIINLERYTESNNNKTQQATAQVPPV